MIHVPPLQRHHSRTVATSATETRFAPRRAGGKHGLGAPRPPPHTQATPGHHRRPRSCAAGPDRRPDPQAQRRPRHPRHPLSHMRLVDVPQMFCFFWEHVQKKLQMCESALLDWDHRAHTGPASCDPRGVPRAHNTHFQRTGHTAAFRPGTPMCPRVLNVWLKPRVATGWMWPRTPATGSGRRRCVATATTRHPKWGSHPLFWGGFQLWQSTPMMSAPEERAKT